MVPIRATTTRAEAPAPAEVQPRASGGGTGRLLLPLIAMSLALPLLAMAAPRLIATLLELHYAGIVKLSARDGQLPPERLRAAVDGLGLALHLHPSRENHIDLGLLHQALARTAGSGAEGEFEAAIDHYRAGLALAPVDPLTWTRLAWLLERRGRPQEALAAVRFSTLLAAHAPEQLWWRLELWLRLMPALERDDGSLLRRQLDKAFVSDPKRLMGLASHYSALYRVRRELEAAGYGAERLDPYFPVPLTLPAAG